MIRPIAIFFLVGTCGLGCKASHSTQYDKLFELTQPAGTPDAINGTWGGSTGSFETRIVYASDSITVVNKCGATVVGAHAAAKISADAITVLAAASEKIDKCYAETTPGTLTRCAGATAANCFTLANRTLTMFGGSASMEFTKLSD